MKIKTNAITMSYSVYNKTLIVKIDDVEYNLSSRVSKKVWDIGERIFPIHPTDDWEIRKKLRKYLVDFFTKLDPEFDIDLLIF